MRKENTVNRVVKIYDLLQHHKKYLSRRELIELLNEPQGTVSPFLSWMLKTRHLLQDEDGGKFYLPTFLAPPVKVAKEIQKLLKTERLERQQRKAERLKKVVNSLFEEPTLPIPKLEFQRSEPQDIENAIALLKSNGYKVLKQITEFKEI